jgi:hypothetical protein
MTATVIPTTTPRARRLALAVRLAAARLCLAIQLAAERWALAETETYLVECSRDGIVDGLSLRAWRDQCAERRVRIALLEQQQRHLSIA